MKDAVEIARLQKRVLYWMTQLKSVNSQEIVDDIKKLQMMIHKAIKTGIDNEVLDLESTINSKFEAFRLTNAKNSKISIKTEDLNININK